eukprot:symbB.v1.2.033723.t1/scaffold4230.1/size42768/8
MESSTDEEALLPPETSPLKARFRYWWPVVATLGVAALATRSFLKEAPEEDLRQLQHAGGVFYSSAGATEISFDLTYDRVLQADIEKVWPNINVHFEQGTGTVTSQSLSDYTAELLDLNPSPFGGAKGSVKIPAGQTSSDQLDWGQYVVYTRKQVCYIAALIASGNVSPDYNSGLSQLIPPDKCLDDLYQAGFLRSLLGLLAACSVDPTLDGGSQGA